jgi:hypothetical protein
MITTNQKNNDLELLDRAFLNSILSYAVYTERQWTLENHPELTEESEKINKFLEESGLSDTKNINLKKAYEIFLTLFNKETFKKVNLINLTSGQEHYGEGNNVFDFQYESGNYTALNNLAKAGVYQTENLDGTNTLHLSFRGTDSSARSVVDYALEAYTDMENHYGVFKPLEKAILEYSENPKNNISSIHVSGHSLGGAMVQSFFNSKDVKNSSISMEGFTYGAPGAKKNIFHKIIPDLIEVSQSLGFVSLGLKLYKLLKEEQKNVPDERITQFTHKGDLVPKLGSVLYDTIGKAHELEDNSNNNFYTNGILNEKSLNHNFSFSNQPGKKRLAVFSEIMKSQEDSFLGEIQNYLSNRFAFKHHDMLRYSFNIESEITSIKRDLKQIEYKTPYLTKFSEFKKKFNFELSSFHDEDLISNSPINSQYVKKTPNGQTIYRLPERANDSILKAREYYFGQKLTNLAINNLKN